MNAGQQPMTVSLKAHAVAISRPDADSDVLVWDDPSQPAQLGALVGEDADGTLHWVDAQGQDLPGVVLWADFPVALAATVATLRGTSTAQDADAPLGTVTAGGTHHAAVCAFLSAYYGSEQDTPLDDPLHTVTTKPRFALVMVDGVPHAISDIGMRMLQPHELYRAQGFPASYIIDRGADGRVFSKAAQVRMCGNSVCPPLARALVTANFAERQALRAAA